MAESTDSTPKRPLGIWLLTIYYGLFAGLLPLVAVILAYLIDERRAALDLSWLDLALSVLLGAAILVSAVGVWWGSNRARIVFVLLLSGHPGR